MDYYKYQINCTSALSEILMAFLGELPFDTFQETPKGIDAFIAVANHKDAIEEEVVELTTRFDFHFEKELIKGQNWNKVWESNFQPIIVGDFCGIRADFHELKTAVQHEIIINPKMAFGTGHHATTFMVIEHMEALDFKDKNVLDFGCGTGILAILAARLKARSIEAVDIELASYENTLENAKINGISGIKCVHGILKDIKGSDFDIILANINRNVILEALPTLYQMLVKKRQINCLWVYRKRRRTPVNSLRNSGFFPFENKK